MAPIRALIFDFGNVLCTWTPPKDLSIPPKKLKQVMSSDIWFDYERGHYTSEEDCYLEIESRFGIPSSEFAAVMKQARQSLQPQVETLDFLANLKTQQPSLKIYGFTNTPSPEQDAVHSIGEKWPVFDHIYISGNLGMRKPEICSYKAVLCSIGLPADSVVFVDDSSENIMAAQSLGIHSILFQNYDQLSRQIENVMGDPIERGRNFLRANAKQMHSVIDKGTTIRDNFAQLLILELTQDRDLVELETWDRTWNYFIGTPQFTTESFPNDLDTTSIALSVLPIDKDILTSVMDEMLTFTSADGIFMTYFDRSRPRVDPVVCVNVLNLFCKNGRESEVTATFDWVLNVLRNRAYQSGSRYYSSPDVFLYFLSRLSRVVNDPLRSKELMILLKERVSERIGAEGDSISLATRLLASHNVGIINSSDLSKLCALQGADGGWPIGWVYKYGSSGLEIGNRGLSTALAVKAIAGYRELVDVSQSEQHPWWHPISLQRAWNIFSSLNRKTFATY